MRFVATVIPGISLVDLDRFEDARGYFARSFSVADLTAVGIPFTVAQANIGFNVRRGTIRGLHFQRQPVSECKLVRCTRGAIYDVIVDIRPESPTYLQSIAFELDADSGRAVYIPEDCAHGYQTLLDNTQVDYLLSAPWVPAFEDGYRYDDPKLNIEWPLPVSVISQKDRLWPLL